MPLKQIKKVIACASLLLLYGCQTPEESAQLHLRTGRQYLEQGQLDQALLEFKAANQDGRHAAAYCQMALIDEMRGALPAMRLHLQSCLQIDEGMMPARLKLAQLEMGLGNLDEATRLVDGVLATHADDAQARLVKARIDLRRNRQSAAAAMIAGVLAAQPENADAHAAQGEYFLRLNELEQAGDAIAAGLRRNPADPFLWQLQAALDARRGDTQAGIADLNQLIRLNPHQPDLKLRLVSLYLAEQRLPEAEALLQDSITTHPARTEDKLRLLQFLHKHAPQRLAPAFAAWRDAQSLTPAQTLELAHWLMLNGHAEPAATALRQLADDGADEQSQLAARTYLAEIDFDKRNLPAAAASVAAILKKNSDFLPASFLQARILLSLNQPDAAIRLLNELQWSGDDSGNHYAYLGLAYLLKQDPSAADRSFRKALEMAPANPVAFLPVFTAYLERKQRHEARHMLEKALQARPQQEMLLIAKARLEIEDRNWDAARSAVELLAAYSGEQALVDYMLGNILQGTGRYREAIAQYQRLLDTTPENPNLLLNLANCYEALQAHDQAVDFLTARHTRQPDNMAVVSVLGRLYLADNAHDKARSLFAEQIERTPNVPTLYLALARVDNLLHRDPAVIRSVLEQGLLHNPENSELVLALGDWYYAAGDNGNARRYFEQAWTLQPESELTANNLANLLLEAETAADVNRGRDLARRFKNSENPVFADTYAWSLVRTAQADKAIPLLIALSEKSPEAAEIHYHLGMAYLTNGQPALAEISLRRALDTADKQRRTFPAAAQLRNHLQALQDRHG